MPYKDPKDRNFKREYELQVKRGDIDEKIERQREGKDVSHKKPLSKGGSNKDGYFIESRSKNRSRNYKK